ncbi:hypothetical protein M409DRAFT_50776 [Zasmidium cellare ATCC 36951]|uniref:Uncharacterized protein n=1 Tax=Zasmidium cellare ATCC 36951 TaxID=1080233 RepID=A0A6A6CZS7_ZASCE|nr:uncharacterized protein M409DRAFT_50776 [Zasmidium cellare ATCC 36951]KAF2171319.1 hypothetical protein M409DRAFT_50776 [Zasmidium cellare ATCC 36951]
MNSICHCLKRALAIFVVFFVVSYAQQYVTVPASRRHYGRDGPWYAVTVNYGGYPEREPDASQWQSFDLFPGGHFYSSIISPQGCVGNSTRLCGLSGTNFNRRKTDDRRFHDLSLA